MDIGECSIRSTDFPFIDLWCILLDTPAIVEERPPGKTVRIPYALVPGMNIYSNLFFKALSTLAKQVSPAALQPSVSASDKKKPLEALCDLGPGMSSLLFFCQLSGLSSFADIPAELLGDLDKDLLKRARDVLADNTIRDLIREDSNSPTAFRAAIRQQIVQLCIRLRVNLIVIDRLMAVSNSLIDKELK